MPFLTKHVRLTNAGKLPDLFVTAKVQSPADLADARLGKLFFVIQIDAPWNSVASVGQSIINVVSREYFRQEATVPLDCFERAVAKANRLIDQLSREDDGGLAQRLHALIALVVGDEVHLAYAGEAEAYFLRDGKISLITEAGPTEPKPGQAFHNLITGEVSAGDLLLLGNPALYEAVTSEELELTLKQSLESAAMAVARRLKSVKARRANAILVSFTTIKQIEEQTLSHQAETIYLDQRLDSTWAIIRYHAALLAKPIASAGRWLAKQSTKLAKSLWQASSRLLHKLIPRLKRLSLGAIFQPPAKPKSDDDTLPTTKSADETAELFRRLPRLSQLNLPKLPKIDRLPVLQSVGQTIESGVPIHHYSQRRSRQILPTLAFLSTPWRIIEDIGRQFRRSLRRNPRLWYITIALILLASIGASIQTGKERRQSAPSATAATVDEMKALINEAKQARVYGNTDLAREKYIAAMAKGRLIEANPKLAPNNRELIAATEQDLLALASATKLSTVSPQLTISERATAGLIRDGILYYATEKGEIKKTLLTGGEATTLASLPAEQAVNQLHLDESRSLLHLQVYDGTLYRLNLNSEKLDEAIAPEGGFPVSTGLAVFGETLYLLDPADNQIWKYPAGQTAPDSRPSQSGYIKKKVKFNQPIGLAIDGSVFVLDRNGTVNKFSRGNLADWRLSALPKPFDVVEGAIAFSAREESDRYYLADRGNASTPPRIIEYDKNGRFVHQYFMSDRWRDQIRFVVLNPKSRKAWVMVERELYEFSLSN